MYKKIISTPLGNISVASDGESLSGLWLENQKHFQAGLGDSQENNELEIFIKVEDALDKYFKGQTTNFDFSFNPSGSDYQKEVWKLLEEIPFGESLSYGDLAHLYEEKTGRKTSARAIGTAVGQNKISILIPCHRVLSSRQKLTGYAGGVDRKKFLLDLEGIDYKE